MTAPRTAALIRLQNADAKYRAAVDQLTNATITRKQAAAWAVESGLSKATIARVIGTSDSRVSQMVKDVS